MFRIYLLFSVVFTACISTGAIITQQDIEKIKSGKMNPSQIVEKFGEPEERGTAPWVCKGKLGESLTYIRVDRGFLVNRTKQVSIIFDNNGNLCDTMVVESKDEHY